MSVKYGKFQLPESVVTEEALSEQNQARLVAEPFERGYGSTVGSTLRRILLSSLEAPAIISIRMEGVPHEYTAIEGVVEDMTHIILNLKEALLRRLPEGDDLYSRESRIVSSRIDVTQADLDKKKGQVVITLKDLISGGLFDVVNPDLPIFTVTKPVKRQIDLRIAIGRGYLPAERLDIRDRLSDEILIDAIFSPVRLVNYQVENTRVGQDTDYDRLILDIVTDGRISPKEALAFAAQLAQKHFLVFEKLDQPQIVFDEGNLVDDMDQDALFDKLLLRVDEVELSVRSANCLSGANIETMAELVCIPERRMLEFRNFGKKSLNEIKAKLVEMGLGLGMDLSRFGITSDNVKEKVRFHQEERRRRYEQQKAAEREEEDFDEEDEE